MKSRRRIKKKQPKGFSSKFMMSKEGIELYSSIADAFTGYLLYPLSYQGNSSKKL